MCVVAYLRAHNDSGVKSVWLLGDVKLRLRSRILYQNLELQAALYAARLRQLILEGHQIEKRKVYHWTDSLTVQQWLRSAHKKQQGFVANRIGEIMDSSTVDEWRHVKGTLNPADIGTRKMAVSQLLETEWLTRPSWLRKPLKSGRQVKSPAELEEVETVCLNQTLESFIEWTEFSDFRKLLRVIADRLKVKSRQRLVQR